MVNKSVVTRADGVRAVVDSAHAPAGAEAVNFVLVSENGHVVTHSAWGIPIAHWRGRRGRARGTGHPCTNSCQPRPPLARVYDPFVYQMYARAMAMRLVYI